MIELHDLNLSYPGKDGAVHALRDINLHISPGEVFGIIGRSGAGKSSLVRSINLLSRPSSGKVLVDQRSLLGLRGGHLRSARRNIGMVFQHFNLMNSRTVFHNVALPLELVGMDSTSIRQRVTALLELVGLSAQAKRYPAQISGGQKQRVGIARALANQPKVLLSDEATSALDPETTRSILALLRNINQQMGLTIVLITHQMQVIKQAADRMAVIDGGEIVEQGKVIDVFTRPQHATTRSLIDEIVPHTLPDSVERHAQQIRCTLPPGQTGRLLRLRYAGTRAHEPILSQQINAHHIQLSLLHGQIDDIQGDTFAALTLFASGTTDNLNAALADLIANGFLVETLEDNLLQPTAKQALPKTMARGQDCHV